MSGAYLMLPTSFESLDNRLRDLFFKVRGVEKSSDAVVIVDIDEKSMKSLGQWPWERNKIAHILQNLRDDGAGIIGLDIVFSEADKTSPTKMAKKFNVDVSKLPDYDKILALTIAKTPTILGYVFDFDNKNTNEAPEIPAIFMEKHKPKREFLPLAQGVLTNIPIIQQASYSSGYMNNIPDSSGIIRSVPSLIKYDMEVYPSLAFEMYRIALGVQKVEVVYDENGVRDVVVGKQHVKTDRFGRIYLNFRGPFRTYKYISAIDVYNNTIDPDDIKGKFVLMGTSAYGLMDLRATPMDSVIAGVELHATMIDNLLNNDMLYRPSWVELLDLSLLIFIAFVVIFLFGRLQFAPLIGVVVLFLGGLLYFDYYMLFTKHIIINLIFPLLSMILSLVSILGVNYMFEARQKEAIKWSFSKKVSKQVMEDLLKNPESTDLSSKEVEATIYFSDIRSFTTISETLKSPKRITDFLNFYMNAMVQPVEQNSGTIDKFIGDAIMAYWNAPIEVKNHADKAVQTALKQIAIRDEVNVTIREKFGFDVDYGMGINTGKVVIGEIGSLGRSDYTIIGDAVNLASRLEGMCKPYKVRLVISEFTKELLVEEYVIQLLDIVKVKGKHEPVKIYEVLDKGVASQAKAQEIEAYEKAHTLYVDAKFEKAREAFEILYKKYEKYLYSLYIERCRHLKEQNITNFDGVFEYTTK